MVIDSITEEIRATRKRLAAKFDNNLEAILDDIRKREESDGRTYLILPPRRSTIESNEPDDLSSLRKQR